MVRAIAARLLAGVKASRARSGTFVQVGARGSRQPLAIARHVPMYGGATEGPDMLTGLQYELLRRIAPSDPNHLSREAYRDRSKLATLLGEDVLRELAGHSVIDFGCGEGAEALELAERGAHVYGLDIQDDLLARASERARAARLAERCRFGREPNELADAIVALDSFEHFADPSAVLDQMYSLLKPGGRVIASFGPTWYHPLGGHLFSVFPWAHLVFSERALIRWRSDLRDDGATRFGEVAGGLNQMTIARFERLVRGSRFRLERLEAVPIRKLRWAHTRLTREFTTAIVRAQLLKPLPD
jgi:SAM-dependent methyltransferase